LTYVKLTTAKAGTAPPSTEKAAASVMVLDAGSVHNVAGASAVLIGSADGRHFKWRWQQHPQRLATSWGVHEKVVQILVDARADVNAQIE